MDSRKSRANMPDLLDDYERVIQSNPDASEEELLSAARELGLEELELVIEEGYLDELQRIYDRNTGARFKF